MILYIDTTNGTHIVIALSDKDNIVARRKLKAQHRQAEKLLPAIDKLLSLPRRNVNSIRGKVHKNVDLSSITGIIVVNGPGPFTATRIGVTTANALAYALNIKIMSLRADDFDSTADMVVKGSQKLKKAKLGGVIEPFYEREPNITNSKKLKSL